MAITSYKDLVVWQKAMDLVDAIYDLTDAFPKAQQYRLVDQMQRAAVSIPSNIAEGSRRGTRKDYSQFLIYAFSSASELETQLEIASRRAFSSPENIAKASSLLSEVLKMLNSMIYKMRG